MKVIVPFVEQTEEIRANGRGSVAGLVAIVNLNPSKNQTREIAQLILGATAKALSAKPRVYWVEREL